jgi:glycosyltransferase involved in cell wall biosynthesis
VVINPRGIRAYVRNDTFFKAARLVLERIPGVRFICPGMAEEGQARKWIAEARIENAVTLLSKVSLEQMGELFRQAQAAVSVTMHDGTPNSLLEAMACGCYPVAGDLESLREWISPGSNGSLVNPGDPTALAEALVDALQDPELRARAADQNGQRIQERASYPQCMADAERFYRSLLN